MSEDCCRPAGADAAAARGPRWRRVLWAALVVNALMFALELAGGLHAASVSLLADAVDFLADAANYGISLFALGLGAAWRSRAALVKGASMGALGLFVLVKAGWAAAAGGVPDAATMGAIGALALLANIGVASMLYAWREGDAIGNLAVLAAALGVFGSARAWPDLVVAAVMATLALTAARSVVAQARRELRAADLKA